MFGKNASKGITDFWPGKPSLVAARVSCALEGNLTSAQPMGLFVIGATRKHYFACQLIE